MCVSVCVSACVCVRVSLSMFMYVLLFYAARYHGHSQMIVIPAADAFVHRWPPSLGVVMDMAGYVVVHRLPLPWFGDAVLVALHYFLLVATLGKQRDLLCVGVYV